MPSRGTRPNRRPSAVMASSQPAQRAFLEKLLQRLQALSEVATTALG